MGDNQTILKGAIVFRVWEEGRRHTQLNRILTDNSPEQRSFLKVRCGGHTRSMILIHTSLLGLRKDTLKYVALFCKF